MYSLIDYKKISVSLIATVFNESSSILSLLESYKRQSVKAEEFIIVDAMSNDGTDRLITEFAKTNPQLNVKLIRKKTNRSQARNLASQKAIGDYLAFTDAGCILDEYWLEKLIDRLLKSEAKAVGGYFKGQSRTKLEEAIVPYFLQLQKNTNEKNFTPTTRSFLIDKKLWQEMNGLNEKLELSEDYQLMQRIKRQGTKIAFAKEAIVYWQPPSTFKAFLKKIGAFAKSDIEAGIIRPKVLTIFARYIVFILLGVFVWPVFCLVFAAYLTWSVYKNKHNCPHSWHLLPILQLSSDLKIMWETLRALPKFNSRVS